MAIELSDELLDLERTAWAEIQDGTLTVDTAARVQAEVTAWAKTTEQGRDEVEAELKRVVRHGG